MEPIRTIQPLCPSSTLVRPFLNSTSSPKLPSLHDELLHKRRVKAKSELFKQLPILALPRVLGSGFEYPILASCRARKRVVVISTDKWCLEHYRLHREAARSSVPDISDDELVPCRPRDSIGTLNPRKVSDEVMVQRP